MPFCNAGRALKGRICNSSMTFAELRKAPRAGTIRCDQRDGDALTRTQASTPSESPACRLEGLTGAKDYGCTAKVIKPRVISAFAGRNIRINVARGQINPAHGSLQADLLG